MTDVQDIKQLNKSKIKIDHKIEGDDIDNEDNLDDDNDNDNDDDDDDDDDDDIKEKLIDRDQDDYEEELEEIVGEDDDDDDGDDDEGDDEGDGEGEGDGDGEGEGEGDGDGDIKEDFINTNKSTRVKNSEKNKKPKNSNNLDTKFNSSLYALNDDLEINDSPSFLEKIDEQIKNNYINKHHQECLHKNIDEIRMLSRIEKDNKNIVIDNLHKTLPILTKYEKTRILGIRVKQLNNGSKPYINIEENILDNFLVANLELRKKKIPFIIQRPLPNGIFEYWKLQDLEILD